MLTQKDKAYFALLIQKDKACFAHSKKQDKTYSAEAKCLSMLLLHLFDNRTVTDEAGNSCHELLPVSNETVMRWNVLLRSLT